MSNEQNPRQTQPSEKSENSSPSQPVNAMKSVTTAPPLVKHEFSYDPKDNNAETRENGTK